MKTVTAIRIGTAAVWLVFGVVFKPFDVVPRHLSFGLVRPVIVTRAGWFTVS